MVSCVSLKEIKERVTVDSNKLKDVIFYHQIHTRVYTDTREREREREREGERERDVLMKHVIVV